MSSFSFLFFHIPFKVKLHSFNETFRREKKSTQLKKLKNFKTKFQS